MKKKLSLRERVALGECVSPYTTERCPVCIDVCEAFQNRCELEDLKKLVSPKQK